MGNNNTLPMNCGFGEKDYGDTQETTRHRLHRGKKQEKDINIQLNNNQKIQNFKADHQNVIKVSSLEFPNSYYQNYLQLYIQKSQGTLAQVFQEQTLTEKNKVPQELRMYRQENQVSNLLESLVYSLAYLNRKNIKHNNFYPTTIYISTNCYKIQNPIKLQGSSYYLTHQRKRFSFLSPQLILAVLDDIPQQKISQQVLIKGDIFAIGMILLQFCTLLPSFQCYDQENYNILNQVIVSRLNTIKRIYPGKYGQELRKSIQLMLEYQVDKRINIQRLSNYVYFKSIQYKKEIQNNYQIDHHIPYNQPVINQPPPYAITTQRSYPIVGVPMGQTLVSPMSITPTARVGQKIIGPTVIGQTVVGPPTIIGSMIRSSPSKRVIYQSQVSHEQLVSPAQLGKVLNNPMYQSNKGYRPFEQIKQSQRSSDHQESRLKKSNSTKKIRPSSPFENNLSKTTQMNIYRDNTVRGSAYSNKLQVNEDYKKSENNKYESLEQRVQRVLKNSKKIK